MFSLEEIIKATKAKLLREGKCHKFKGISIDSRSIKEGEIFLCIKGKRFDGHEFISEAISKGAKAIILDQKAYLPKKDYKIPILCVSNTIESLARLALHHRKKFSIPLVAITGSNGKTTTKEMLSWILQKKYHVLKNEGTKNNLIGLSLTLLNITKNHQIVVVELGMNRAGEIKKLSEISCSQVGIINNNGVAHLEFFKDIKAIAEEKYQLLKNLKPPAIKIINSDDIYLKKFKGENIFSFGIKNLGDFRATQIKTKEMNISFLVNDSYHIQIPIGGFHNVYNALAAIAIARIFGLSYLHIREAFSSFKNLDGRLSIKKCNNITLIDDTYNANPISLAVAIDYLSQYKSSARKICVIGDMLELGWRRKFFYREIAEKIKNSPIDSLITVGKLSGEIADHLKDKSKKISIQKFKDTQELIPHIQRFLRKGDVMLIKGSRNMHMEKLVERILNEKTL